MPRLGCKRLRMKEGMGVFWLYPLFLIKSKSFSSCFFFFCSNCVTKKWAVCNQPFLTELSGKNNLSKPDNKALRWIERALLSPLHRGEIKPLLVWHPFWCPGRPMWSPLPRNFISLGWGKELGMTDDQCPEEQYMVREHKRFSSSLPVTGPHRRRVEGAVGAGGEGSRAGRCSCDREHGEQELGTSAGGAERRSPAPGRGSSRRLGAGGEDSWAPTLEMSLKGAQGLLIVELLLWHLCFFFSITVYYEILNMCYTVGPCC